MKTKFIAGLLVLILSLSLCSCGLYGMYAEQKRKKIEKAKASQGLGEAYMGTGDYTKALREFLKAESYSSENPYIQDDLGIAYLAKKDVDLAIVHFKKALEIKPDYSPARNNLGSAYLEQENWDAAIASFKAVQGDLLYGTPHYPLTNLGFVYYKLGDYDKAIGYYEEALDLKDDFPKALQGLGLVYMAEGNYPEAIEILKKTAEIAPNEARIHMNMGEAYQLNQEYSKAYQAYNKAADLATGRRLKQEAENKAKNILKIQ